MWPSNSTPRYISKKNENLNSKWYRHPNANSNTIYNSWDKEASQVSYQQINERRRYTHTHTHNGVLLRHKNEILPFAVTWIDIENIIMLSEISQTKTNTVWYHLNMQS